MKPKRRYANRRTPKPRLLLTSRCGKEFDGDPKAVLRLRREHELKCRACQKERPAGGGEEE